jgi:glycosyltransferase involved in cell wall biosynthesis
MTNPLVSVVVPNYNHAQYLGERLDSVLNQTHTNLEVLLLDDCSIDNSREILRQYAAKDNRIRLIFNEQNSGSTFKQWNKGFAQARGEFIWIAESDDAAAPTFLTELISQLELHPQAGLAFCQSQLIDAHSQPLTSRPAYAEEFGTANFCIRGEDLVRQFMALACIIPNASAVLMRSTTRQQVGLAPEHLRLAGDWQYWVRYLLQTDVCFIGEPLNYFRTHPNNVRSRTEREGVNLLEMADVLNYIKGAVDLEPSVQQQACQRMIEAWFHTFIYAPLSLQTHQTFVQKMRQFNTHFTELWWRQLPQILLRRRLSGFKMLIGDKILGRTRRAVLQLGK